MQRIGVLRVHPPISGGAIEVRCENDTKGRKIGLYSEKKNGRIEERDYPVKTNIFYAPIQKLLLTF